MPVPQHPVQIIHVDEEYGPVDIWLAGSTTPLATGLSFGDGARFTVPERAASELELRAAGSASSIAAGRSFSARSQPRATTFILLVDGCGGAPHCTGAPPAPVTSMATTHELAPGEAEVYFGNAVAGELAVDVCHHQGGAPPARAAGAGAAVIGTLQANTWHEVLGDVAPIPVTPGQPTTFTVHQRPRLGAPCAGRRLTSGTLAPAGRTRTTIVAIGTTQPRAAFLLACESDAAGELAGCRRLP
jgi:hypothetical protein